MPARSTRSRAACSWSASARPPAWRITSRPNPSGTAPSCDSARPPPPTTSRARSRRAAAAAQPTEADVRQAVARFVGPNRPGPPRPLGRARRRPTRLQARPRRRRSHAAAPARHGVRHRRAAIRLARAGAGHPLRVRHVHPLARARHRGDARNGRLLSGADPHGHRRVRARPGREPRRTRPRPRPAGGRRSHWATCSERSWTNRDVRTFETAR